MRRNKVNKQPLAIRLYQDEALQAIARLVGYSGHAYPIGEHETTEVYERFGKERVEAATEELLEYDIQAKLAKLKPNVRKLCFGLLGPPPEHEAWFYGNPDGPPAEQSKAPEVRAPVTSANPWESARTIAVVKGAMRNSRRKLKSFPAGSPARDIADDELNELREELSYAADRLAFARHRDYSPAVSSRRNDDSAQAYIVWKLRQTRDALQAELRDAKAGHGDELVIQALAERVKRVNEDLQFQAEELVHDLVQ